MFLITLHRAGSAYEEPHARGLPTLPTIMASQRRAHSISE